MVFFWRRHPPLPPSRRRSSSATSRSPCLSSLSLSFDFKGRTNRPGRCDNTWIPYPARKHRVPLRHTHVSAHSQQQQQQQRLNRCLLRAAPTSFSRVSCSLFIDSITCWTNISLGCLRKNGIILLLPRPWSVITSCCECRNWLLIHLASATFESVYSRLATLISGADYVAPKRCSRYVRLYRDFETQQVAAGAGTRNVTSYSVHSRTTMARFLLSSSLSSASLHIK